MRVLLLAAAALLLAGCSGPWSATHPTAAPATQPPASPQPVSPPPAARTPAQKRDVARLQADVAATKRAAAKVSHRTLMGSPALQRTTGAFLDRLDRSTLEPKMKNRMIDFAASAVAGSCDQCFQMLESARPIPQISGK